ncbi:MAG: sulfurtransferase, partial [Pseudomonadota bacterium]
MKSLIALTLLAAAVAMPAAAEPLAKLLTPQALSDAEGVIILDIRAPKAFAAGHVEWARDVPYGAWRG